MYDATDDPYTYENSTVLVNSIYGIRPNLMPSKLKSQQRERRNRFPRES